MFECSWLVRLSAVIDMCNIIDPDISPFINHFQVFSVLLCVLVLRMFQVRCPVCQTTWREDWTADPKGSPPPPLQWALKIVRIIYGYISSYTSLITNTPPSSYKTHFDLTKPIMILGSQVILSSSLLPGYSVKEKGVRRGGSNDHIQPVNLLEEKSDGREKWQWFHHIVRIKPHLVPGQGVSMWWFCVEVTIMISH